MNQQCKVCGEPAAGFHFGAFTCEGCKSFFGRSYNNLSSISECKNGGECVINKKNRTACKACRLRKCLLVGMSKSGSRYGRRSNWFKIHCLLQEQQQQQQQHHQQQQQQQQQQRQQQQQHHHHHHHNKRHPLSHPQQQTNSTSPSMSYHTSQQRSKEETLTLGLDDYKNSTSPSISSPESHNSDSSVEISERRATYGLHPGFGPLRTAHLHPHSELSALSKEMMNLPLGFHLGGIPLVPPAFLPPPTLTMFSPYHHLYGAQRVSNHLGIVTNRSNANLKTSLIGSSNGTTIGIISTDSVDGNDLCNNNDNSSKISNISSKINSSNNNNSTLNNNNNRNTRNHNIGSAERSDISPTMVPIETCNKRFYLDAILKSQRNPSTRSPDSSETRSEQNSPRQSPDRDLNGSAPPQDDPIDLSMKANLMFESETSDDDPDIDMTTDRGSEIDGPPLKRRPMDLTTRS